MFEGDDSVGEKGLGGWVGVAREVPSKDGVDGSEWDVCSRVEKGISSQVGSGMWKEG